jgi:hypothetical protein
MEFAYKMVSALPECLLINLSTLFLSVRRRKSPKLFRLFFLHSGREYLL